MTDTITVIPQFSFSDVRFTRSPSGHVHSVWWSYDWKQYNPQGPYHIGSHFHRLRAASISAFAATLGIAERNVMVSVRENPHDLSLEWRCSSSHPVELPRAKLPQLVPASQRGDAIDI